ncbi:hypothetical protein HN011_011933 [Eciton burchellii]|jgi:mRNA-degrading endonuclease toxin of MazEF toxin-antitoxin module|nr:hypothetical protein HN011_011933 [Eciton burchellii]
MKVLFLLLGTITLAVLALPEANAVSTADDVSNSLTDKVREGISAFLKKLCAKICEQLKTEAEVKNIETAGIRDQLSDKLGQLRESLMKKCNC